MKVQKAGDALVIVLDGVFDASAAHRLARTLAETGVRGEIQIDLTHVREFHDFGVTVLAEELAARGTRVAVRGLRQHHVRLLRYLGFDTGELDLGAAAEAV
jgi:anti-anti-sigma regulatory factor